MTVIPSERALVATRAGGDAGAGASISLAASIELDRSNLVGPLVFAGLYALMSILVLPWQAGLGWFVAIAGWEVANRYVTEPFFRSLPEKAGIWTFAGANFVGGGLYCVLALASLR